MRDAKRCGPAPGGEADRHGFPHLERCRWQCKSRVSTGTLNTPERHGRQHVDGALKISSARRSCFQETECRRDRLAPPQCQGALEACCAM
jgi:hypothetical protein